jgi:ribonuclease P protein component
VRLADSDIHQTLIAVRRKYGKAVQRNLARRRIRAICREFLPGGHPGRILHISLSDRSSDAGYRALRGDVRAAFAHLGLTDP